MGFKMASFLTFEIGILVPACVGTVWVPPKTMVVASNRFARITPIPVTNLSLSWLDFAFLGRPDFPFRGPQTL